jgi:hypothetical protein
MDTITPPRYQYASLPPGAYFRTLVLLPGSGEEPLQCNLQTLLLSETHFEAISYVWGSDVKDHEIVCEGRTVAITSNLWTVLQHIRSNVPRVLWADSICINQENLEEKAQQVRMMGQIYRSADRVLIFIGSNDCGHGPNVSSLVDEMSAMIKPALERPDPDGDSIPYLEDDAPILKDTRWESFEYLLEQSWFTRGWVAQEAALAKDGQIIWGEYHLKWTDLMFTITWLFHRAHMFVAALYKMPHMHAVLYWHYHKDTTRLFGETLTGFDFLDIINTAKSLQFSDPRDMVFAFGEIALDFDCSVTIQPDYNAPVSRVYQQFAMDHINQNRSSVILDHVSHTEESMQETAPSWFPRWDVVLTSVASRRSASGVLLTSRSLSFPEPVVMDESILKVRGVIVDTVEHVSNSTKTSLLETSEMIEDMWRDVYASESDSAYPTAYLLDVFLHVLTVGQFIGQWTKWKRNMAALALHLLENIHGVEEDEMFRRRLDAQGGDIDEAIFVLSVKIRDAKLILTRRGYIGLAPHVTEKGDIVAIIFGCATPHILRKTGNESQYRLVGSTAIMGKTPVEYQGHMFYCRVLGHEESKEWVDWDVEEQDIYLC